MKCKEIMEKLEELSPISFASSWDNVGLLLGDKEKEVKKILVALDVTDDVIEQAVRLDADFILSHHPMIFKGVKKVTANKDHVKIFELDFI